MMDLHAAVDFLGEKISLEQAIDRVQSLASKTVHEPWFIGDLDDGYPFAENLTIPYKSFGRFVRQFSHCYHLTSVTEHKDSGWKFLFVADDVEDCLFPTIVFFIGVISSETAIEIFHVHKKYEKYTSYDFSRNDTLYKRFQNELYAPLKSIHHIGYIE